MASQYFDIHGAMIKTTIHCYQTAHQKVLLHTEGLKQPKQGKRAMFKAIEKAVFDENSQKFQLLVVKYDVKFDYRQ